MGRIVATSEPHHRLTITDDGQRGRLILVRGGQRAYLWAGRDEGGGCVTFCGVETLRTLARNILAEIGPIKPKRKR